MIPRVIPCLLLRGKGLVKTTRFKDPKYVGDPINAIRILNEKEVDELILLDIEATRKGTPPPFELIEEITSECFMPVCYGGGISTVHDMEKVFHLGVEKISMNARAVEEPSFVREASQVFGSQSVVVSMDVKRNFLGKYEVVIHNGRRKTGLNPLDFARQAEDMGSGELLVTSVDRDGKGSGYDVSLLRSISNSVTIPVIACGGAGRLEDVYDVISKGEVSAAAAGSLFVFYGPHRAVLINYPERQTLETLFAN